jgi:hypothetical protein
MKPETRFSQHVRRDLTSLAQTSGKVFFMKIQQVALRGDPDFVLCVNGKFVGLELKRSKSEKPEGLQAFKLMQIEKCGGRGFVSCPENWEMILGSITKMTKETR